MEHTYCLQSNSGGYILMCVTQAVEDHIFKLICNKCESEH